MSLIGSRSLGMIMELHKSIAFSDNYIPPKKEIDIYEVRNYVYKPIISNNNKTSYKLIDRRVCEMLWHHYGLVATKIKGKYVFYMFSDGYFQKVDHAEVAKLFDDWLREEEADNYRIDKILKAYPKYRFRGNFVPYEKFNANPYLVNLRNCVYDLKNHKTLPHKQEYYFTYKTDYDYDPYAVCHQFNKALKKYAMSSESWINTFLEICGYIQVGTYEHQKLFWFLGQSGGNGKGTLLRVMHNLVGDHFTFTVPITASLSDKFFRVNLKEKRFAYIPDLEKRFSNLGLIKQITGGDKQMSDVKHEDAVSFDSTSKIVMAMNDLPDFGDGKNLSPLARRLIILNFKCTIKKEEMDSDIDKKLKNELSGIFLKSMEGLRRLQKNGYFTDTKQGLKKVDELINKSKIVDLWIYDNLFFDENEVNNPDKSTEQYLLWDNYYTYLQANHPTWKFDKYLEIKSKSALIKYLLREKFPQARSIPKQVYDTSYHNPVSGKIEIKRGSYQAVGGLRIMTDKEREAMYLSQTEEETG
jgi:P4 family phage/plasmid primase-like protien